MLFDLIAAGVTAWLMGFFFFFPILSPSQGFLVFVAVVEQPSFHCGCIILTRVLSGMRSIYETFHQQILLLVSITAWHVKFAHFQLIIPTVICCHVWQEWGDPEWHCDWFMKVKDRKVGVKKRVKGKEQKGTRKINKWSKIVRNDVPFLNKSEARVVDFDVTLWSLKKMEDSVIFDPSTIFLWTTENIWLLRKLFWFRNFELFWWTDSSCFLWRLFFFLFQQCLMD